MTSHTESTGTSRALIVLHKFHLVLDIHQPQQSESTARQTAPDKREPINTTNHPQNANNTYSTSSRDLASNATRDLGSSTIHIFYITINPMGPKHFVNPAHLNTQYHQDCYCKKLPASHKTCANVPTITRTVASRDPPPSLGAELFPTSCSPDPHGLSLQPAACA